MFGGAERFGKFVRGHYEHFWKIILNLGQWLRRRCFVKIFLSVSMAPTLFGGAERFVQICKRALLGTFL